MVRFFWSFNCNLNLKKLLFNIDLILRAHYGGYINKKRVRALLLPSVLRSEALECLLQQN